MVHFTTPGGDCKLAEPLNTLLSTRAVIRCVPIVTFRVITQPVVATTPVPVKSVPPQQYRYWPEDELNTSFELGSESSWRQTSNTVTEKLQVAVLLDASVAVQVTVVVPFAKHEPDGGVQATVTPGQLSDAVVVKAVTAQDGPKQAFCCVTVVMSAGQVTVGGCVSLTVTVNAQLPPPLLDVQVTVVVPLGKNDPDAGLQVTVPQLPLVVGGG